MLQTSLSHRLRELAAVVSYLFLATCTFYLLPATCCLLLATCYLLLASC